MDDHKASRTALATSLMRALHTRFDRPALLDDPWGERLVSEAEKDALLLAHLGALPAAERAAVEGLASRDAKLHAVLRVNPFYSGVVLRSRYAEEALAAAVARGVRQYVILGAGMDSFGVRQPPFAREVDVFEVDHPATQALKRRRLHDCGAAIPATLHFVAADLSVERLGTALARSTFRPDRPAFFSWLGVTAYLTREANVATLRSISDCTPAGGELVFTYLEQREFDADRRTGALEGVRAAVASVGEPMVSGFAPEELPGLLRGLGLTLIEDLGGADIRRRYYAERTDARAPVSTGHFARAAREAR